MFAIVSALLLRLKISALAERATKFERLIGLRCAQALEVVVGESWVETVDGRVSLLPAKSAACCLLVMMRSCRVATFVPCKSAPVVATTGMVVMARAKATRARMDGMLSMPDSGMFGAMV